MKRQIYLVILLVININLLTTGCNVEKPSEVVKAAFIAANEGKYKEAGEFLGQPSIYMGYTGLALGYGTQAENWNKLTRNGTISNIEILKEDIREVNRGKEATVYFKLIFKDGSSENRQAGVSYGLWRNDRSEFWSIQDLKL